MNQEKNSVRKPLSNKLLKRIGAVGLAVGSVVAGFQTIGSRSEQSIATPTTLTVPAKPKELPTTVPTTVTTTSPTTLPNRVLTVRRITTTTEKLPTIPTTSQPKPIEKAPVHNAEVTPEIQANLKQSQLEVLRRAKGSHDTWIPVGALTVVDINGQKRGLGSAHYFASDRSSENNYGMPRGNGRPKNIVNESPFEWAVQRADALDGKTIMTTIKGIAVSQQTGKDTALVSMVETNAFNTIRPIRVGGEPQKGEQVAVYTAPDANGGNKPVQAIAVYEGSGTFFSDQFHIGVATIDIASAKQQHLDQTGSPWLDGASGSGCETATSIDMGTTQFDLPPRGDYAAQVGQKLGFDPTTKFAIGAYLLVNQADLAPFNATLA